MKQLIVLIAQVKYPSSNASYLSANSYIVENTKDLEAAKNDFVSNIEVDDFQIINNLFYIVSQEQIADANK